FRMNVASGKFFSNVVPLEGSLSTPARIRIPARRNPRLVPPHPEKKSTKTGGCARCPALGVLPSAVAIRTVLQMDQGLVVYDTHGPEPVSAVVGVSLRWRNGVRSAVGHAG